jgi:beta-lactamase class D
MLSTFHLRLCIGLIIIVMLLVGCVGTLNTPLPPPSSTTTATPASEDRPELEKYFQGFTGAFVLYDLNSNRYIRYSPERCSERFLPASTFKIMNSLIGLETGIIPDENYVIKWDGAPYDTPAWNQDHTLKTALQNSVVWYYQELARRVGKEKMQHYIDAAGYGNKDISGQIDSFWLDGALRISADEQVELLKRLYRGDLPFSQRTIKIVKEILILEKTETGQLSGKTGAVQRVTTHVGWFVGTVERKGNIYFFATNLESQGLDASGVRAKEISQNILQSLGLLQ